ncbi:response regulator [Penaeicola halotolerans]|uniref:response regulator n=1 Tax=Penaeicola halotolerans TaxID=2793196 RepID=UPI001CF888BA|nr:response regulator [Penaeicola halotolerans]
MVGREIHILLVEDNEGDVLLTLEALSEIKIKNKVTVLKDGVEALDFLKRSASQEVVILPDLILLDINLPRKNGFELLRDMKQLPHIMKIPVVMLTTSNAEEDIQKAYDQAANYFISKPLDFTKFMEVIRSIEDFWISVIKIPSAKS